MRFLTPLLSLLIAAALVAPLAVTPAHAQSVSGKDTPADAAQGHESELRAWFNGLPRAWQGTLRKRLRILKHLPKETRQQMLQNAKEGKPILSDQQRRNLQRLRKLSYLQRIRLYTTASELQAMRRGPRGNEVKQAMKLSGRERVRKLHELLNERRAVMFVRSLPQDKQEALRKMSPDKRRQAVRRMFEQESKSRLEQLEGFYPKLAELQEAADKGDKEADGELRRLRADLHTLDLLVQRLSPDKRKQMMEQIRELTMPEAANAVRKALKEQWQNERKNGNPGRRKGNRQNFQPERRGHRAPEEQ